MFPLPLPFREHASAAAEAVVLDAGGWGAASPPASPHLAALQRSIIERVQVRLRYAGRSGGVTTRTVDPLGVAAKGGAWHLLADTPSGRRTFRGDRVRAVTLTDRAVVLAGQAAANGLLQSAAGRDRGAARRGVCGSAMSTGGRAADGVKGPRDGGRPGARGRWWW